MIKIRNLHHIAIICKDYERSKRFYTAVLGFKVIKEVYREDRQSYKLDLSLNGKYLVELFSFPDPPIRVSGPEATGLRHIAFAVEDIRECILQLALHDVVAEPVRIDEYTQKKFTFITDPDNLPIELYEL